MPFPPPNWVRIAPLAALIVGVATHAQTADVFWSEASQARRIFHGVDESGTIPVVIAQSKFRRPTALAVDRLTGDLFYGDGESGDLMRLDPSTGQSVVFVENTDNSAGAVGINIDRGAGLVYWVDKGESNNRILRAAIDGSSPEVLIENLRAVTDLAILPTLGIMFWSEVGAPSAIPPLPPRIVRATLDGANIVALPIESLGLPHGLALSGDRLYWAETRPMLPGQIRWATLDGALAQTVAVPIVANRVRELEIFDDRMFWIEGGSDGGNSILGDVRSATLDGSDARTLTTLINLTGLAVAPSACPIGDLNGDRVVTFADLNILLALYGATLGDVLYLAVADLNGDGAIGFADLNVLLSNFNLTCE